MSLQPTEELFDPRPHDVARALRPKTVFKPRDELPQCSPVDIPHGGDVGLVCVQECEPTRHRSEDIYTCCRRTGCEMVSKRKRQLSSHLWPSLIDSEVICFAGAIRTCHVNEEGAGLRQDRSDRRRNPIVLISPRHFQSSAL